MVYKSIFRFFNIIGILCFKFDGKKFTISKVRLFLSSLFISGYLSTILFIYLKFFFKNTPVIKITNFSKLFFEITSNFNFFTVFLWIVILLTRQKNISKILSTFCELKKVNFQIKTEKLEQKVLLSFIFYNFVMISFTVFLIYLLISDLSFENLNKILIKIIRDFPCILYSTECLCFCNLILIHYEFLIENFNQLLYNQVELMHNDCINLLENLNRIQRFLNFLNQTFGSILSLIAFNHFIGIVAIVSF